MSTEVKDTNTQEPFFDFSELYTGCPVLVSSDPSCSDETFGYVTTPKPTGCDVIAMYGGWNGSLRPFADCWHVDDPRVKERPAIFEDELRGVFRLAPQELTRIAMLERLAGMEQIIAALIERVEELEPLKAKVANLSKGRRSSSSN